MTALRHGSALINGRGQYNNNNAPLSWFNVSMASDIGFYFINPGMEYTYNISIDHHSMDIVGLGIGEVEPITVDAVYLNPGNTDEIPPIQTFCAGFFCFELVCSEFKCCFFAPPPMGVFAFL